MLRTLGLSLSLALTSVIFASKWWQVSLLRKQQTSSEFHGTGLTVSDGVLCVLHQTDQHGPHPRVPPPYVNWEYDFAPTNDFTLTGPVMILRPEQIGFHAVYVSLWLVAIPLFAFTVLMYWVKLDRDGRCQKCHYDLTADACPECGTPVASTKKPADPKTGGS